MIKKLIYDSRKQSFSKEFIEKYTTKKHLWCVQVYYTLGQVLEEYEIMPEKKVPFNDLVLYMKKTVCDLIPDEAENSYFTVSKIKHTTKKIKQAISTASE